MKIAIKKISSPEDFQKCMDIRIHIFVQMQNVTMDEEVDGQDQNSEHFLLFVHESAVGTARVRYINNIAKIERVAVLEGYQGKGLGQKLMEYIIADICASKQAKKIKLSSQSYAISFYEKLGFQVCSEEYIDAKIPHKDMELVV